MTTADRFWARVDRSQGCWLWLGYKNPGGYGRTTRDGAAVLVHRYAYKLIWGSIPDGLTLDHLCRVRHCVNPFHLEPVTSRENTLRGVGVSAVHAKKTHCVQGHPFDEQNTFVGTSGQRYCRACRREYNRRICRRCRDQQHTRCRGLAPAGNLCRCKQHEVTA